MKLQKDKRVKIKCPNPEKYPAFYAAFAGRVGIIERFSIDFKTAVIKLGDQHINVEANERWLQNELPRRAG